MNLAFWKKKQKEAHSTWRLRANDPLYNKQFGYADNYVKTSKYNLLTFIPLNLFEQFQRIANCYFLALLILEFCPPISSVPWYTTLIPLVIVLLFSAIKDGYDDVQRHMSDRSVNSRQSFVVRQGRLAEEPWAEIRVGDVIRMTNGQFVAADLLLLSTSEPHGICYIETKELDGETNLKARAAMEETVEMEDDIEAISRFYGEVECETPNNRLDKFHGQLKWQQRTGAITATNVLLRGCILKNTRWCYGLVLFAGNDTKLMRNSGKSKFKRTSLDRFLNTLILGIVVFLSAMCLICSILCGVWEWTTGQFFRSFLPWDKIIPDTKGAEVASITVISVLAFFSYIILLNTVVPISLYVSVEIIRFIHSMWINSDEEMYFDNGANSVAAHARTTTLNEELGQVQYIFTDKTGTLTRNVMTFNKASINGRSFGDARDRRGNVVPVTEYTPAVDFSWNEHSESSFAFYDRTLLEATKRNIPELREFWLILSLCHTVMPERGATGQLAYQAQSPDEAALTSAARNFGFVFLSRTPNSITILDNGREVVYELLCILDFNNERKRMSVILRCPDGRVRLFCKGADMMVMARLKASTPPNLLATTNGHLDEFAQIGLRTLCLASKDIHDEYLQDWMRRRQLAAVDMDNRDALLDELYEEIEKDLTLVGATAIEDKLQEGVPEAIDRLARANIKIWVLTGDKTETAINIAYSCNLLTDDMRHVAVVEGTTEEEVEEQLRRVTRYLGENEEASRRRTPSMGEASSSLLEDVNPTGRGVSLVINGDSLSFALGDRLRWAFLDIACACKAVICCRVTPLQKAQVVELVKRNRHAVTLAIGDGANDVSMIKSAHIGVGISGQEGMQAVLSSDYSIGQFKYLERLLLVHGRWSYLRMCKFLRYFFYKDFSFTLTHFWFAFFAGYSAQSVFDSVFIATYNLIFTSFPVLAMGVLDQDVDDYTSLKHPRLYTTGQRDEMFNMRKFTFSVLQAIATSLVLFFVPYGAYYNEMEHSGRDMGDLSVLSFTSFTGLILVVTLQMALDTLYWTWISHVVIWGSLLVYVAFTFLVYEVLGASLLGSMDSETAAAQNVVLRCLATPHFWFSILLILVVLLLPVLLTRFFWLDTSPTFGHRLRATKKIERKESRTQPREPVTLRRASTLRRSQRDSYRSSYAFSHEEGFGELIQNGFLFSSGQRPREMGVDLPTIAESPGPMIPPSERRRKAREVERRREQAGSPVHLVSSRPLFSPVRMPQYINIEEVIDAPPPRRIPMYDTVPDMDEEVPLQSSGRRPLLPPPPPPPKAKREREETAV